MIEKRAIPFGPSMPEKYCRLLGFVGGIHAMRAVGEALQDTSLMPADTPQATLTRRWCMQIADGKINEFWTDLENNVDSTNGRIGDTARQLKFARHSSNRHQRASYVLDGHARMALQYVLGESDLYVPDAQVQPVGDIFTFYAERACQEYVAVMDLTDTQEGETKVIARAIHDVQYEVKYV